MKIRPMEQGELQDYVRIFLAAFTSEPWNEPWTRETAQKRLEQFMQPDHAFGLCMEEDGEVIAFILGRYESYYDGPRFFIEEFCCARRSGGHGTKLLWALEEALWEQGVVRITLMTIHGDDTEGYYNRRGYVTDPESIWMYKKSEV